ncbi:pirin family protein [Halomonas sp. MCCC 1A17488]|uniref:Pirin family protein n=1 Tax=Billgrantia sulfidoxydans TaxID=2733484 RepID=A0ABX7W3L5_9GAMM|nr:MULTISPECIES: pirin family protein [Halomonas]MCE8016090.1 pirin family protein [Halomonas sp. MCCC 1A17488]MCG3239423.1 pirin family protein [Halomonas sp. MCCC 1A17488]QPP50648.1 pirin family protein [Halomonas sp. SS10-MC5]QTP54217.1 pirin family protein [Halomonas sulfidoxydans]
MVASPSFRRIERLIQSHPSQDGDGVHIQRIHRFDGELDPFLMLDELGSDRPDDYIGGFPPHPHRGIQTLTYIIHGGITHEDHLGHSSAIQAGGAQWMHTGRGIVHSEMPLTDSQGLHGFQLWLNLPAREKMSEPRYRDVRSGEMPRLKADKAELIALGGHWTSMAGDSIAGPLESLAGDGAVAHAQLKGGGELTLAAHSETLAVYVFEGTLQIGEETVAAGQLARLGAGDTLALASREGAQCLLLAGTPHREPIAHYGPFVMNHMHEIDQALRDYRNGSFTD